MAVICANSCLLSQPIGHHNTHTSQNTPARRNHNAGHTCGCVALSVMALAIRVTIWTIPAACALRTALAHEMGVARALAKVFGVALAMAIAQHILIAEGTVHVMISLAALALSPHTSDERGRCRQQSAEALVRVLFLVPTDLAMFAYEAKHRGQRPESAGFLRGKVHSAAVCFMILQLLLVPCIFLPEKMCIYQQSNCQKELNHGFHDSYGIGYDPKRNFL